MDNAVVYDTETFPNCFTLQAESLNDNVSKVWEISFRKDERTELLQWFRYLHQTQTFMIGFNNLNFDYPIIHALWQNPSLSYPQLYAIAQDIIHSKSRFGRMVWANERFAPQIDLFKMNHFDNKAKRTSLKALQINMRSPNVIDMPVQVGTELTVEQIDDYLIPYGINDTRETKTAAHTFRKAIDFRLGLVEQFGIEVMNWSDSKIGEQMMIQKLGKEVCYDYSEGRRKVRQTIRTKIHLKDVIFPYIHFRTEGFNQVLSYLKEQILTIDDLKTFDFDETPKVETKGVFKGLKATYQDIDFHFGVGGLHGSLDSKKVISNDDFLIRDIDVASLYPSIAIVNRMYPEHLGQIFTKCYAELPKERKRWQAEKGKKCTEANTLKLASNSVYGNSNNPYSVFFDTEYTMRTTINGQLMLSMLVEWLSEVSTLRLIQANTDGITYYIHKDYEPQAVQVCKLWEDYTCLVLEDVDYKRMWIRDVNNYIAEDTDGNLKLKGAYWSPDPSNYAEDISSQQPPAWHKDLSATVAVRAAVQHMVKGVDIEQYIKMSTNPYDFMYRIKVRRGDKVYLNGVEQQKTGRYFVSKTGGQLYKISPPTGKKGAYKRRPKITKAEYERVMNANGWQWAESVCTKNKSVYEETKTAIQAGQLVTMCNNVKDFDFNNLNYTWYIQQAKKLVIN